jgi:hypothetical protein
MCCADDGLMSWSRVWNKRVPAAAMMAEDAADLGRCRRGVEPLRVVIMPQQDQQVQCVTVAPVIEPMPIIV